MGLGTFSAGSVFKFFQKNGASRGKPIALEKFSDYNVVAIYFKPRVCLEVKLSGGGIKERRLLEG